MLRRGVIAMVLGGAVLAPLGALPASPASAATNAPVWDARFGLQGVNGVAEAVAWSGATAYIGGAFSTAAGMPANTYHNIVKWTAGGFKALGGGVDGEVEAIVVIGTDVYAAGSFNTAGGLPASNIARWDGHAWHALGGGITAGSVYALAVVGGRLYVGGSFSLADGRFADNLAVWDPATAVWNTVSSNVTFSPGGIYALSANSADLVIGGGFGTLATGSTTLIAPGVVVYDTTNTSTADFAGYRFIGGVNGNVLAMAISPSGDLYVGGSFTVAGPPTSLTTPAANIAVLTQAGTWAPLGSGISGGQVQALTFVGADSTWAAGSAPPAGRAGPPSRPTIHLSRAGLGWQPVCDRKPLRVARPSALLPRTRLPAFSQEAPLGQRLPLRATGSRYGMERSARYRRGRCDVSSPGTPLGAS